MFKSQSASLLIIVIAIIAIVLMHHSPDILLSIDSVHIALDILAITLFLSLIVVCIKRPLLETNTLPLSISLFVCESVILALRNRHDMTEVIGQLPLKQQLEAIRFMEFLQKADAPDVEGFVEF